MANKIKRSLIALKSIWNYPDLSFSLRDDLSNIPQKSNFYTIIGGGQSLRSTQNTAGQVLAYQQCAPLAKVINHKAKASTNAKWYLLDEDQNESNSSYAGQIRSLMSKPNPLQTWNAFLSQARVYEQLFGEVVLFALKPIGFDAPEKTKALWVIPNWMLDIKLTGKMFMQTDVKDIIEEYAISWAGVRTPLPRESVIHIRDINQNLVNPQLGESRLRALENEVSNIMAAYQARNVMITRKGALGILSNNSKDVAGSVPLLPDEKKEVQDEFQKYGLSSSQWQVIITSANLRWQSMTFPTKDLMLFEEIEDDVRQITDTYDYPFQLLGFKGESALGNGGLYSEAKKALYQDAIIPEVEVYAEALNNYFDTEKYGFKIQAFFDHIDVLQENEKDKAETFKIRVETNLTLYEKNIITLNQFLANLEIESREDGDKYYYQINNDAE
jgi:hypothetical protein